ncbi:MAG: hypothetical protein RLZZ112_253 [Verrucomicrobiota bacterium]
MATQPPSVPPTPEIQPTTPPPTSVKPRTGAKLFTLDPEALALIRFRAKAKDPALQPALDALRKRADEALAMPLVQVTAKPKDLWARSGDPKDYLSVSKFAWPDPANPGKWIMIDGKPNEEAMKKLDGPRIKTLGTRITALAEGWYFLGDTRYAQAAAEQLRAWFLDPVTGMNPNMNFAQAIKPDEDGKPWGIIDANRFPEILNSVGLLADSGAWSAADDTALQDWFRKFKRWLVESPLGKSERAAKNNHGTFYDLILATGAAYTGDDALVREVLQNVGPGRLDGQVAADGSTPEETQRAESAMYTLWNLTGLCDLADLGKKYDVEIWNYPDAPNAKLRQIGNFLLPYALGDKEWAFGQQKMSRNGPREYFRRASAAYGDPKFEAALHSILANTRMEEYAADRSVLLRPWPAGQEPWLKASSSSHGKN